MHGMMGQSARNLYGSEMVGPGASAIGGLGATPVRQPEVECEMDRLAKAITEIGAVVDAMVGRLVPVRSQSANSTEKDQTCVPEPVLCGMASMLRANRQRLLAIQNELGRALNELEI